MPTETVPTSRLVILWVLVIGLLAFALSPALTRSHVEGFSYFTETLSILLPDLSLADPLWAVNTEFFYLSRPGVIWALAPLSSIAPGDGYDILMWVAMPLFLCGLVILARSLSGASWLASVTTLLILPIALEINFFTNDNIVATTLTVWAVILGFSTRSATRLVAAGAFYSLAVLCRLDQVLLAPLLGALVMLSAGDVRAVLKGWSALAFGFIAIHACFALLDPQAANLLHRITVATEADALWGRTHETLLAALQHDASAALFAFGVGLPAIIAGAFALGSNSKSEATRTANRFDALRAWGLPVLLFGYPFFIYALTIGKYYDPRGFMTMLPMVVPLSAAGLQRWVFGPLLAQPVATAQSKIRQRAIAFLLVLPCLYPGVPLPPSFMSVPAETENAAPSLSGRIWYGNAWRDWQARWFASRDRAIATWVRDTLAVEGPTAILTTDWTDDRRVQNILAIHGFRPQSRSEAPCGPVAEVWTHLDGASAIHIRTHIPFMSDATANTAAIFLLHGADCIAVMPEDRRFSVRSSGILVLRSVARPVLPDGEAHLYMVTDAALQALREAAEQSLRLQVGAEDDVNGSARTILQRAQNLLN